MNEKENIEKIIPMYLHHITLKMYVRMSDMMDAND